MFNLVDHKNDNKREFDSRSEAESQKADLENSNLGYSEGDLEIVPVETDGDKAETRTIDDAKTAEPVEAEPVADTEPVEPEGHDLPDEQPGVDTDPLDWVPSDFVDTIDGKQAINRKGYDVLAHHYNISVTTEVLVSPSETDFEYAEVVATAETEDGVTYTAHGSAHVDRGDDSYLLLEMADTRSAKRATARATGVGMVAVQELQNEL